MLMTSLLMLLKVIAIESVQRYFVIRNCCSIVSIDSEENDEYEMETEKGNPEELMMDFRLHSICLLFGVLLESLPLSAIICSNSWILLDDMTWIAYFSLGVSGNVVLRNISCFWTICVSPKSHRENGITADRVDTFYHHAVTTPLLLCSLDSGWIWDGIHNLQRV